MSDSYTKAEVDALLEKAVNDAVEKTLRVMPFVVQNLVASVGRMQKVKESFYQDHKELVEHKELVVKVMEDLESRNPTLKLEQLADLTAQEAKRRLAQGSKLDTSFPSKPSKSELQHGLDEILEKL